MNGRGGSNERRNIEDYLNTYEARRISAYFSNVIGTLKFETDFALACVAHMVPNSVHFLNALSNVTSRLLVLPKPKSIGRPEYQLITSGLRLPHSLLSRKWARDSKSIIETLSEFGISQMPLVVIDIGGYFSDSVNDLADEYDGHFLGVMEGTENGVQKYERRQQEGLEYKVPIVTVARSPLKLPEDYLVGSSVVFSVEAVLREVGQILQTRSACVIGYGRVGRSVAAILRGRGISTVIYDTDPIAMAEATAQGYQCFRQLANALQHANLVIGATGNRSLDRGGFASLNPGTLVATVTSADDEIEVGALKLYGRSSVSPHIARYEESDSRYFWLVNDGNAANFLHGAVIGPAIQLIEGEKISAVSGLVCREMPAGISEVGKAERSTIAEVWNEHFLFD